MQVKSSIKYKVEKFAFSNNSKDNIVRKNFEFTFGFNFFLKKYIPPPRSNCQALVKGL